MAARLCMFYTPIVRLRTSSKVRCHNEEDDVTTSIRYVGRSIMVWSWRSDL